MIVPIETMAASGPAAAGAATTHADLSMDLYERDGAYVAEVYLGRCDDRALRIEAERAEVALVGALAPPSCAFGSASPSTPMA